MRVERSEDRIKLTPETDFERQCLEVMRRQGIRTIRLEDDWKGGGPTIVELHKPWEERR
jgi:hypothetical protein